MDHSHSILRSEPGLVPSGLGKQCEDRVLATLGSISLRGGPVQDPFLTSGVPGFSSAGLDGGRFRTLDLLRTRVPRSSKTVPPPRTVIEP